MGAGVSEGSCSNRGEAGLLVSGMPGVNGLTPGLVVGLDDGGLAWVVDLAAGGGGR